MFTNQEKKCSGLVHRSRDRAGFLSRSPEKVHTGLPLDGRARVLGEHEAFERPLTTQRTVAIHDRLGRAQQGEDSGRHEASVGRDRATRDQRGAEGADRTFTPRVAAKDLTPV